MGIPGVIRDPFFLQPSHLFPYNPYKRSYGPLLITPFLSVTQVAVALSVLIHSTAWMVLQPPQVWSWKVEGHAGRTIKSMRSQIKGSKKWYYYMDIDIAVVILYTPSLIKKIINDYQIWSGILGGASFQTVQEMFPKTHAVCNKIPLEGYLCGSSKMTMAICFKTGGN